MLDFKILETGNEYPDVLVHRVVEEEDTKNYVEIKCFGEQQGTKDLIFTETITFENLDSARLFISEFSEQFANQWCKSQKVKYQSLKIK